MHLTHPVQEDGRVLDLHGEHARHLRSCLRLHGSRPLPGSWLQRQMGQLDSAPATVLARKHVAG